MRLLAFSDLHRDRTMHRGLEEMIEVLSAISAPAVLVPGNAETDTELWQACASWSGAHVLHGQALALEGVQFFGLGGGVPPTPFPWSFDLSEEEAAAKLESCHEGAILVVHSPPKGHLDEVHGRHLGRL